MRTSGFSAMSAKDGLKLSDKEIGASFSDPLWAGNFPPILSVDQVAELLQVPKATVYDWRSRGLLKGCCRKVGRHLRFYRDRLIKLVFNEGINDVE